MPAEAHASLIVLAAELQAMRTLIASIEKRIIAQHRSDEASKRLRSIPGIGLVGATAIVATITDPKAFRSGRDMAAWIGLVPRQDLSGGKQKLGPISNRAIDICVLDDRSLEDIGISRDTANLEAAKSFWM